MYERQEQVEIDIRLGQLQEEHRKAMDIEDWPMVNKLQERISEVLRRRERLRG